MSGTGIELSPDMDPGETLAHYGVKGMRWGKTTKSDSGGGGGGGSSAKTKTKTTSADVTEARERLTRQASDYRSAKNWAKKNTARGSVERTLADKKVAELKTEFLKNPDRLTALKLTTGEKAALTVMAPWGGAGVAANRVAQRKFIESRQRRGVYDK